MTQPNGADVADSAYLRHTAAIPASGNPVKHILPFALATMLLPALAVCAAETPATAFLEKQTENLKGLHGEFIQTVYDADGQAVEETSGEVSLRAPRQFRWEYKAPFPQLIVADGDRVWIYDPDLEQVSVRRQGNAEQQSPLLVLIDPSELERQFNVEGPKSLENGVSRLVLTPRNPEAGMTRADLDFRDDGLDRMSLVDSIGQRTEIRFSAWERNPAFADGWFGFDPPDGVDVVGDLGEDAEVTPLGE